MANTIRKYGPFINGRCADLRESRGIEVRNPATGEIVAIVEDASAQEVNAAVMAARTAFEAGWGGTNQRERSEILRRIAALVRERVDELAAIELSEVGRPISELKAVDIPETADCFEFYAAAARVARGSVIGLPKPYHDFTVYDPVGVVGQITPWNFPLNLASWKVAPALAMGNCVVLKPSEYTPSTAIELAKIAKEAGLPDGVLNVVTGYGATGGAIVEHPDVDMVAFTGSQATGFKIAEIAGRFGKRVSLELGGKSAQIVFADADLDAALAGALEGSFFAQGENCCAGSRLLVERRVKDKFVDSVVEAAGKLVVGRPDDPGTQVGCLISMNHYERVKSFVDEARKTGAVVATRDRGMKELAGKPFLAPTVVVDPPLSSRLVQEEVFGPVLAVSSFTEEDEAVRLANGTKHDLAAAVWTSDVSRVYRVARRLRAGTIWINTYNRVFNDAPFGGYRWSGHSRDLGLEALQQYTNVKNVCICTEPGADKWFSVPE